VNQVGAGNAGAFQLMNNGSSINGNPAAPLTLDGNSAATSGIAVLVSPAAANAGFTFAVANVTIRNTGGDGIRVTNGTLNVGAGVVQSSSAADGGTVVTASNVTGIRIAQSTTSTSTVVNDIAGLVSWQNSSRDMTLLGGSKVKLRGSVLGGAPEGIRIGSNGGSDTGSSLANIDLGTATDFGNNYIQAPNGANGVHSTAGICLNLTGTHPPQTLRAAGNFMATAGNPGTQLDCATAGGTVSKGTNCNVNQRWSIGNAGSAGTPVTYVLDMCN
jgi:hypothetical protein